MYTVDNFSTGLPECSLWILPVLIVGFASRYEGSRAGEWYFGRVDTIPGVGHVATKFFHFAYIPFIPMGTVVVKKRKRKGKPLPFPKNFFRFMSEDHVEPVTVRIPFSFKSLLIGYIRGWAPIIPIWTLIWSGADGEQKHFDIVMAVLMLTVIIVGFTYLPFLLMASYDRAYTIAKNHLGFKQEKLEKLKRKYGKGTPKKPPQPLPSHRPSPRRRPNRPRSLPEAEEVLEVEIVAEDDSAEESQYLPESAYIIEEEPSESRSPLSEQGRTSNRQRPPKKRRPSEGG